MTMYILTDSAVAFWESLNVVGMSSPRWSFPSMAMKTSSPPNAETYSRYIPTRAPFPWDNHLWTIRDSSRKNSLEGKCIAQKIEGVANRNLVNPRTGLYVWGNWIFTLWCNANILGGAVLLWGSFPPPCRRTLTAQQGTVICSHCIIDNVDSKCWSLGSPSWVSSIRLVSSIHIISAPY